ncbi:hypothetical protein LshimejAT787_1104000 [Lyophyllum shimeji]|uniref:Uncharacterized protein n=1 Tax=Lyophyllum shimeji TaxID=47721 RepID=A0A9P3USE8_LYOSH|nr:hypothetical protein LshimejAT787_1104000 [Lyophyllum shimeji]
MSPQAICLDEKSADEPITLPTCTLCVDSAPVAVPDSDRRKKLRFLPAIFLVWLTFELWSYLRFQFYEYNRYGYYPGQTSTLGEHIPAVEDLTIPSDVEFVGCTGWESTDVLIGRHFALNERFASLASFSLPIESDKLFMLARGSATGALKVRQGSGSEDVKVEVEARYRIEEALDAVRVCTVTQGEGVNGLGIFGPERSRHNFVRFDVTLYLPEAANGPLLDVKSFQTDAPLFVHDIGDLERSVHFDEIIIKSANTPIFVKSLRAGNAALVTRNSPISGTFNVTSSIKLITANAPVDVKINVFNEDKGNSTDVVIKTSNAQVMAALKLESANKTGGEYHVSASTSNAALNLTVSDAPARHTLCLDAHTSVGPAVVQLHETYEGTFAAETSVLHPELSWKAEDPGGKGRRRMVEWQTKETKLSGRVWWSADEGRNVSGKIKVETSLAPLRLEL